MNIETSLSPNFDERLDKSQVCFLILHYTACDFPTAYKYLTMERGASSVSAHYLIGEDGRVVDLVCEDKRAWHAGISRWGKYQNLNTWSIGIELVNLGHELDYTPFTKAQTQSLMTLSKGILSRHPIPAQHVLGHADIAPTRKKDPGELLDWRRLADEGIGLQLPKSFPERSFDVLKAQQLLLEIGYDLELTGQMDRATQGALRAFCMRLLPQFLDKPFENKVMGALYAYLEKIQSL